MRGEWQMWRPASAVVDSHWLRMVVYLSVKACLWKCAGKQRFYIILLAALVLAVAKTWSSVKILHCHNKGLRPIEITLSGKCVYFMQKAAGNVGCGICQIHRDFRRSSSRIEKEKLWVTWKKKNKSAFEFLSAVWLRWKVRSFLTNPLADAPFIFPSPLSCDYSPYCNLRLSSFPNISLAERNLSRDSFSSSTIF